jgi:hypothetical protein
MTFSFFVSSDRETPTRAGVIWSVIVGRELVWLRATLSCSCRSRYMRSGELLISLRRISFC